MVEILHLRNEPDEAIVLRVPANLFRWLSSLMSGWVEHTAVQMLPITAWKRSVVVLFISVAQRGTFNICGR